MANTELATISLAKTREGSNLADAELQAAQKSGAFELDSAFFLNALNALFGNEFGLDDEGSSIDPGVVFDELWGKYVPDCINWGKEARRKRFDPTPVEQEHAKKVLEYPDLEKYPRHDVLATVEYELEWDEHAKEFLEKIEVPRLMAMALCRYRSEYPKFGAEINLICIAQSLINDDRKFDDWAEDFSTKVLTGFGAAALRQNSELLIVTHDKIVYDKLKMVKSIQEHDLKGKVRIVLEE